MLYRFRCALARLMYGRNGPDQLGQASVWAVLVLEFASLLLRRFTVLSGILSWVALAGWIWILFRVFSKNLSRRREENQRWVRWWQGKKNAVAGARARRADKEHKYFTCHGCGAICRVPVGKGKIEITCPRCGAKIQAKT